MEYNFVAVEGNIGAGKTSLTRKIASDLNGRLIQEQFAENAFLPKFYREPAKYAFPLELSFLAERYQQMKTQLPGQELFSDFTISDYLFDKSLIFAMENLEGDLFHLFRNFFNILKSSLPKPGLILYLFADVEQLMGNIRKRGRAYEKNIRPEYLQAIQKGYLRHFETLRESRILILDINHFDFIGSDKNYLTILEIIGQKYNPGIHHIKP